MRKLIAAVFLVCVPMVGAFCQTTSVVPAPTTAPSAASDAVAQLANMATPKDATELMSVGRKVNGLQGEDVQPWHMKASYEVFDNDGKSKSAGTYEEWWVSEKQYRRSYQSPEFSQVEYGTDHGIFRTLTPQWPSGAVALVRELLVSPVPDEKSLADQKVVLTERTLGGIALRCSTLPPPKPMGDVPMEAFPAYCFSQEKPILRLATGFGNANYSLFNRILVFRGRYLAGDIEEMRMGKVYVKIHLDSIESLRQIEPADFQPPQDAVAPPPRRVQVSSGTAQDHLIRKVQPVYPADARQKRISGTVVLLALISRTGHIERLAVVSGPTALQQAAIQAVRLWLYKPYLVNGEAVEVEAQINVVFGL